MTANAVVQTLVDPAIKDRASAVLDGMGLTLADAVRIMLTRTANEGALPFDLQGASPAHDAWFRAQIDEALDGIKAGTNALIGEAEWKTIADAKRAELEGLASAKQS